MRLSGSLAASTLGLLFACTRPSSSSGEVSLVSTPATLDLPDAFKTSEDSGADIARDATADGSIEAGSDASHALKTPFTGLGLGGPPETPPHGWTAGQVTHGPRMRDGVIATDRLPMEVVRRIMRANFPRFRSCYEAGLRNNPALHGRVTLKFVIDTAGNTKSTQDGGSDLPDPKVIACMINVVQTLSFPSPESGEANVVYPISFEPTDE